MVKLQLTVYRLGDLFEVRDINNNLVTNRDILDQIAFDQMPGFRASFTVIVAVDDPAILQSGIQHIDINTRTTPL